MTHQVIDESIAMQWCQHQRPLMLRVLASFYQQYRQYLQPCVLTPDHTQQLAHDLKSSAPNCGATALSLIAQQLAPPSPAPSEAAQQRLLNALTDVMRSIELYYPAAMALVDNGQKDRLQELRQALEQHNLRAVVIFEAWAAEYARHWPEQVVGDIQHALNTFDFKHAQSLLNTALLYAKENTHNGI